MKTNTLNKTMNPVYTTNPVCTSAICAGDTISIEAEASIEINNLVFWIEFSGEGNYRTCLKNKLKIDFKNSHKLIRFIVDGDFKKIKEVDETLKEEDIFSLKEKIKGLIPSFYMFLDRPFEAGNKTVYFQRKKDEVIKYSPK